MLVFTNDVKSEGLDKELLVRLEQASTVAQMDLTITSGLRSGVQGVDHGIKNGPHMSGSAVDLRCHDSVTRYKILKALLEVGFKRIGIGKIHLHCDVASGINSPQMVAWLELNDDK